MVQESSALPRRGRVVPHLYVQVLVAIVAGAALGHFEPDFAASLKPLGDVFVKAVKMLIAPLIFCTVVHGIAGMKDVRRIGRVGLKALIYFEVVTTLALVIGLAVANLLHPGTGMNVDSASLDPKTVHGYAEHAKQQGVVEFLTHIVPATVGGAFAEGDILQVLFLAVLFAFALFGLGERGAPMMGLIESAIGVFFGMVGIIMRAAPVGAFGAMAFTIGKYGVGTLLSLGKLMLAVYSTCLLFIFVVLGAIAWANGFSILRFIRFIKEELLIVLGTSSSESVLPGLMAKLRLLGCEESVVGLVVPAGYSFNLDGTCIYLTMAAMFLAQATNTDLTLWQQAGIILLLLLTSKGAAGVTGSGFVTLAATLASLGTIPVASIAIILGIDRFMSEARALTNLIGNGIATVVVARWEGAVDENRMKRVLRGEIAYDPDRLENVVSR